MSEWEDAILDAVASAGGEADLSHIYSTLQGTMQLTKQHLRATQWGGRPAYQHQVRSHITNLAKLALSVGFHAAGTLSRQGGAPESGVAEDRRRPNPALNADAQTARAG